MLRRMSESTPIRLIFFLHRIYWPGLLWPQSFSHKRISSRSYFAGVIAESSPMIPNLQLFIFVSVSFLLHYNPESKKLIHQSNSCKTSNPFSCAIIVNVLFVVMATCNNSSNDQPCEKGREKTWNVTLGPRSAILETRSSFSQMILLSLIQFRGLV